MVQNSVSLLKITNLYTFEVYTYGIELCANKDLFKKKLLREAQLGTTEPILLEYVLFGM